MSSAAFRDRRISVMPVALVNEYTWRARENSRFVAALHPELDSAVQPEPRATALWIVVGAGFTYKRT